MPNLTWNAREHHQTYPFPFSEHALDNVQFRLGHEEDVGFSPLEIRRIDKVEDWEGCSPELLIELDEAALMADTGVSKEEIEFSVIVRDRDLNKFEKVKSWPLVTIPIEPISLVEDLQSFSWARRLDIAVIASLASSSEESEFRASQKGSVLANKTFSVRVGAGRFAFDIPRVLVDPEAFVERNMDRNTVWYVHWKGADYQRTPGELLEIWYNKEYEDKFIALAGGADSATRYILESMGADIFFDILSEVLRGTDNDVSDPASLISMVQNALPMDIEDARLEYMKQDGSSRLRSRCWKAAGTNSAFASLKF